MDVSQTELSQEEIDAAASEENAQLAQAQNNHLQSRVVILSAQLKRAQAEIARLYEKHPQDNPEHAQPGDRRPATRKPAAKKAAAKKTTAKKASSSTSTNES